MQKSKRTSYHCVILIFVFSMHNDKSNTSTYLANISYASSRKDISASVGMKRTIVQVHNSRMDKGDGLLHLLLNSN